MRVVKMKLSVAAVFGGLLLAAILFEVHARKVEESDEVEEGRRGRGLWIGGDHRTGMNHGHGHGWMKLHTDKHHDHSSKLSEAYVKFHGLGGKEGNSNNNGGLFGRLGNVLKGLGIGRGHPDEDDNDNSGGQSGWGNSNDNGNSDRGGNMGGMGGGWGGGQQQQPSQQITMMVPSHATAAHGPPPEPMMGGGGGGWGPPPSMMQMQSGWSNPQMQMIVAQPTGWASSSGGSQGGSSSSGGKGGNRGPTGWASGDFASYKPPKGGNRNKGHFQLNLPSGRPAYIQKLTPIIDIPKVAMHGWRR